MYLQIEFSPDIVLHFKSDQTHTVLAASNLFRSAPEKPFKTFAISDKIAPAGSDSTNFRFTHWLDRTAWLHHGSLTNTLHLKCVQKSAS